MAPVPAWACVLLALGAAALPLCARASHAPWREQASSAAASEPSGFTVRFAFTNITLGQPALVNVSILSPGTKAPVRWRELQVDAARR